MFANSYVIVYSTDDNYAQHTGVSMLSLFENNKVADNILVYIIDNNISNENKKNLNDIAEKYRRNIEYIDFSSYKSQLKLNMIWNLSLSAYARLFIASMVPQSINRIIYYDCDSVITASIKEFWNIDISGYTIAGVSDPVSPKIKEAVGLGPDDDYINSGVLLIDLGKWRNDGVEKKFINFIEQHKGKVLHHDQGVINGALCNSIKVVHPKFNVMTAFYMMNIKNIQYFYGIDNYYRQEEIDRALKNPVFIHYTPGFTSRPWIKGCKHPRRSIYLKYLESSPWKGLPLKRDTSKKSIKITNWIYRNVPLYISKPTIDFITKIKKHM